MSTVFEDLVKLEFVVSEGYPNPAIPLFLLSFINIFMQKTVRLCFTALCLALIFYKYFNKIINGIYIHVKSSLLTASNLK